MVNRQKNKNVKAAKDQLNTCKGFIMIAITNDGHLAYINENAGVNEEEAAAVREVCRRLSIDEQQETIPEAEIVE